MEYAIGLYLDKDAESKFIDIMRRITQKGVNAYMQENRIPPHISLSCFSAGQPRSVISLIDAKIDSFAAGSVFWASVGAFLPHTVFAAPVLNEYLSGFNAEIYNMLKSLESCIPNLFYLPYQWAPHTTLAVKMTGDEIKLALDSVADCFAAFGGLCDRLFFAECEPFREIKTWELPPA